MRSAGFTLIELSIVLVIIGLVVGGLLMGNEMIEAARLRAQIKQAEEYGTAIAAFKNKYGNLPGDLSLAQCQQFGFVNTGTACAGHNANDVDNNGQIEGTVANLDTGRGSPAIYLWGGVRAVFSHLTQASLIPGKYIENTNIAYGDGESYPAMAMNKGYGLWVTSMEDRAWLYLGMTKSQVGASSPEIINFSTKGVMTPQQAYSLDAKLDNGIPASGKVRAYYPPSAYHFLPDLRANKCSLDTAGAAYNLTDSTEQCRLMIQLY